MDDAPEDPEEKATGDLGALEHLEGFLVGGDASGGEHPSNPKLRSIGWSFQVAVFMEVPEIDMNLLFS